MISATTRARDQVEKVMGRPVAEYDEGEQMKGRGHALISSARTMVEKVVGAKLVAGRPGIATWSRATPPIRCSRSISSRCRRRISRQSSALR